MYKMVIELTPYPERIWLTGSIPELLKKISKDESFYPFYRFSIFSEDGKLVYNYKNEPESNNEDALCILCGSSIQYSRCDYCVECQVQLNSEPGAIFG